MHFLLWLLLNGVVIDLITALPYDALIWRNKISNPEPPVKTKSKWLNQMFGMCEGANCDVHAPFYPKAALPQPGPLFHGEIHKDGMAIVAHPFDGLRPLRVQRPFQYKLPKIDRHQLAFEDSMDNQGFQDMNVSVGNLQRAYMPLEKPQKPESVVHIGFSPPTPAPTTLNDNDIIKYFVPTTSYDSEDDAAVGVHTLQQAYNIHHERRLKKKDFWSGKRKPIGQVIFDNDRLEMQLSAPKNKPFNGWGDPRLRHIIEIEKQPKKTRRLVRYGNGPLREQFGSQKPLEPEDILQEPETPFKRVKNYHDVTHFDYWNEED